MEFRLHLALLLVTALLLVSCVAVGGSKAIFPHPHNQWDRALILVQYTEAMLLRIVHLLLRDHLEYNQHHSCSGSNHAQWPQMVGFSYHGPMQRTGIGRGY